MKIRTIIFVSGLVAFMATVVFINEVGATEVNQDAGDVAVSGGTALGLSGGDMDINDCLATHSVVFGLWQGTHINKLCVAERMNRDGKYQEAAEMKCSTRGFRNVYGRGQKCVDAVILSEPVVIEEVEDTHYEDEEDWHEEQMQMQQDYEERIDALEARANRPRSTRVVEQKPLLTEDQKARLEEVLKK